MKVFGVACFVFPITYISVTFIREKIFYSPIILVIVTTIIGTIIAYKRYCDVKKATKQEIYNPSIVTLTNQLALYTFLLLTLVFLLALTFLLFGVAESSWIVMDIIVYSLGTLYMWTQLYISTYQNTMHGVDKVQMIQGCLAAASFLILIVTVLYGFVTTVFPKAISDLLFWNVGSLILRYLYSMLILSYLICLARDRDKTSTLSCNSLLLDERISLCGSSVNEPTTSQSNLPILQNNYVCLRKSIQTINTT